MDRAQLQQLAELRLRDADALLTAGRWDAAYYLLAYCVECALKACVAKQFRLHEVPDKKLVNSFYTHSFDD
jgi:HEPN domain-containing protein